VKGSREAFNSSFSRRRVGKEIRLSGVHVLAIRSYLRQLTLQCQEEQGGVYQFNFRIVVSSNRREKTFSSPLHRARVKRADIECSLVVSDWICL
jgi:hypothetical protein